MTQETVTIRTDDVEALLEAVMTIKLHPTKTDIYPNHSVPSLNAELMLGMYDLDETVLGRVLRAVGEDPFIHAIGWEEVYGGNFCTGIATHEQTKTLQEEEVLKEAEKAGHVFTDRG